jgi:predicted alpha/beta hydrolase family esterase
LAKEVARGPDEERAAVESRPRVLVLPGICNSGPRHWQTLWESRIPGCARLGARDWSRPDRAEWVAALESALAHGGRLPVILVAHSVGCLQVVHWAAAHGKRAIQGALLVAPPDPTSTTFPRKASGFAPLPDIVLPFPSMLVASSDDPYASLDFSRRCAQQWHSHFVEAGPHGHLNADSNLGDWPEGRALLERLCPGSASRP